MNPVIRAILTLSLILSLIGCGATTPPLSVAPGKALVRKAIALQLNQTQEQLSQQLETQLPKSNITRLKIEQIEPLYLKNLATYHILGTYKLKVKSPSQETTQEKQPFDIYIQRQVEGKTWRLLIPQPSDKEEKKTWRSYLLGY